MWRRRVPVMVGVLVLLGGCSRKVRPGQPVAAGGGSPESIPAPQKQESPAPVPDLTLLYSGDVRGLVSPDTATGNQGGLARRATLVDRVRLEGVAMVQLDAGDFLPGRKNDPLPAAPYTPERRVSVVLNSYRRMGVDVVTVGEREIALGRERLLKAIKAAKLTVVATNLFGAGDERPFSADQLIDADGLAVGVFGILDVDAKAAAKLRRLGFHTTDPIEAARASIRSLRERGARLVVGLFHLAGGLPQRAQQILAAAAGADLVVLGHASGDGVDAGASTMVGRTRVVRPALLGTAIGRLDVRGLRAGGLPQLEERKLAVTPALPLHFGVSLVERVEIERVRSEQEEAAAVLRRRLGQKQPSSSAWENWTYASARSCAMCHEAADRQWKTTDHAQAMATLERNKHNLDPACLGCHTTGYLQPGGTQSVTTATTSFPNVGCECCHGASAEHVRSPDKKKGTSRTVEPEICLGCHTSDQNIGPFDYASALKSILGPGHGAPAEQPPSLPAASPHSG